MMFLEHELLVKVMFLCSSLFSHLINAKKAGGSDEAPDYYPRVNPNPSNIEELNVHDIDEYFNQFNRYYEVVYSDDEHEKKSHETFANNIKRIIILNKFTTMSKLGINEFSHMTLEEFTDKYTGFNDSDIDNKDVKVFTYNTTAGAPPTLDWRLFGLDPVVRHQGPCKSSYVFSALGNIETQLSKTYKRILSLSEQQAYDCEPTGNCKRGGMPHKVFESIKAVGGIQEQETYLYNPNDKRECKANKSQMVVKITNIIRFKPTFEDSLTTLLALYGPLVTTIYVSESVKNYMKGILAPTDCDRSPNHAVLLVGYGISENGIPFWVVKNSWGHSWGDGGYMRLIRGSWACNIGDYVTTAIVEPIQNRKEYRVRTNLTADHLNTSSTTLSTTSSNATEAETSTTTVAKTTTVTPTTVDSSDASNFTPKSVTAKEMGTIMVGDLSAENPGKLRKGNVDRNSNDENKSSENSSTEKNQSSEEIKKITTPSEGVKKKKKKKLRTLRSSDEKPNFSSNEPREPLTGAIMDEYRHNMRAKSDHELSGEGKVVTSARKRLNGNKYRAYSSDESDDRSSVLSSEEKKTTIRSTNGYLDHV